jgi:hypothetical protein
VGDVVQRGVLQITRVEGRSWGYQGPEGTEAQYMDGVSYMTLSFGMFVYSKVIQLQLNITKALLLVVPVYCKNFFFFKMWSLIRVCDFWICYLVSL